MTVKWKRVTEERYDYMLGVLPPIMFKRDSFMVGEPCSMRTCAVTRITHSTYAAFVSLGDGKYVESCEALTTNEFLRETRASILANIDETIPIVGV